MNKKEIMIEAVLGLIVVMLVIGAMIAAMGIYFKLAFGLLVVSLAVACFIEGRL